MLGFGWLALKQAQEAVRKGLLEEARCLVTQPAAQGHKRSWDLLRQIARGFVERGENHLRRDDPQAAWADLVQAEQMGVAGCGAERLRQALVKKGADEVRALLAAGEPARAAEAVARLKERSAYSPDLESLDEAARAWQTAKEQAARGEFANAVQTVERVRRLLPDAVSALEDFRHELQRQQLVFPPLLVKLHEAAEGGRWRDVIGLAEQVLAVAPQHPEARRVQAMAWKSAERVTVAARPPATAEPAPAPAPEPPQRVLLWIDGVGGYLICLGTRLTIGQSTADTYVDVPLIADVSRLHATLTRDAEGYLLESVRPVLVNGRPVDKALLRPNDRVTLGDNCQMQFRQPAAVSTSARLDLVSGHRMPLAVDGVLLMADTLLLGPGTQVHVCMPDLKQPVVLFRGKDGLGVRHAGGFSANGRGCKDRAVLGWDATVTADDFAFAIEALGTRMGRL